MAEASNLASTSPGAGLALVDAACRHADATGTTIVADTDGGARARLYRRFGFEVVIAGPQPWAPSLLVRYPSMVIREVRESPTLSLDSLPPASTAGER